MSWFYRPSFLDDFWFDSLPDSFVDEFSSPKYLQKIMPAQLQISNIINDTMNSAFPPSPALESAPPPLSSHSELRVRNKHKREADAELLQNELFVQEQKRIRLEVFDPIMEAFNTGDFDQMANLVRSNCHPDVVVKMPQSMTYPGVTPILVLWGLLHKIYPDAMIKILERRISSSTSSIAPIQLVEYVFKFHGSRITTKPVLDSFSEIMDSNGNKPMSHQEMRSVISRHMNAIPPTSFDEHECSFIAEVVLSFDNDNKIIEWRYDILASSVN